MNSGNLAISVVTICYNASNELENTIKSVLSQSYSNIEFIIVDGGSTDSTMDVIHKYDNKITKWVSEPDDGIYDAMNKGLRAATGHWINFMNAGDVFASDTVIEDCFANVDSNAKVIYGNRIAIYKKASYLEKPAPIEELAFRFPIFHQSTFIEMSLMKELEYDTTFKICGDFNFFHKIYKRGLYFQYTDTVISKCDCVYGISNTLAFTKRRIYEDCMIVHGRITIGDRQKILYGQVAAYLKWIWQCLMPASYERWRYRKYDNNPYLTKL